MLRHLFFRRQPILTSSSIPSMRTIGKDIEVLKLELSAIQAHWKQLKPMNIVQYAENIAHDLQEHSLKSEQVSQHLKDFTAQYDSSCSNEKQKAAVLCAILDYNELITLKKNTIKLCENINEFYFRKQQVIDEDKRRTANTISKLEKLKGITNNFKIFHQIRDSFDDIKERENSAIVQLCTSLKQIKLHSYYAPPELDIILATHQARL